MDRRLIEEVRLRAMQRCEYCRMPELLDAIPFEVEHVRPIKHAGQSVSQNLALACFFCNRHKGPNIAGYDPQSQLLTRLFDPRTDAWDQHFAIDGPRIKGMSDVGRTTVEVLSMNDPRRVEFRRLLLEADLLR